jgi:SnoaL-like domain
MSAPTTDEGAVAAQLDRLAIKELVDNWIMWRDGRNWERFYEVCHPDCVMVTTWGGLTSPQEFAASAQRGFDQGDRMLHSVGGAVVELAGTRAISQSKMRIMQRGPVDGVMCDVTCIGRCYDFFEKRERRWGLVLRQPIYERDSIVPVNPDESVTLDPARLARYPEGYARLAYLQEGLGWPIIPTMPTETGPQLAKLYAQGKAWLAGGELTWTPT